MDCCQLAWLYLHAATGLCDKISPTVVKVTIFHPFLATALYSHASFLSCIPLIWSVWGSNCEKILIQNCSEIIKTNYSFGLVSPKKIIQIKKCCILACSLVVSTPWQPGGEWQHQRSLTLSPSNSVTELIAKRQKWGVLSKQQNISKIILMLSIFFR